MNTSIYKPYPGILQTILIIFLFIVIFSTFSLIVSSFNIPNALETFIIHSISFFLVIEYCLSKIHTNLKEVFQLRCYPILLLVPIFITIIGLSIIILEINNIINLIIPMPSYIKSIFSNLVRPNKWIWISYLTTFGTGPFLEEILCRGIIFKAYLKRYSCVKAIVVSSVFFSILHLNVWQLAGAIITGIFFSWLFMKTNSLWFSIIAHIEYNLFTVILIRVVLPAMYGCSVEKIEDNVFQPIWFDLIAILLIVFGILWLVKIFKKD